jgi:hypothetical protein
MPQKSIFLALPHYGQLVPEAMLSLILPTAEHRIKIQTSQCSLLANNFNRLWCAALNQRKERELTHFAMHHADLASKELWLDKMLEEMDRVNADILSAIIPLKDARGLTSTAMMQPGTLKIQRLTMTEVYNRPTTFGPDKDRILLVNSGLWICKLTDQWIEQFPGFCVQDCVTKQPDGTFAASSFSEDWNFSKWAYEKSLRVFATRIIPVTHFGGFQFKNDHIWGTETTDKGD